LDTSGRHPRHGRVGNTLADWTDGTDCGILSSSQTLKAHQIFPQLAAHHPELVTAAVLVGPICPPDDGCGSPSGDGRGGAIIRRHRNRSPQCKEPRIFVRPVHVPAFAQQTTSRVGCPILQQPILVVSGERDPICRPPWARETGLLLPHCRCVEIPGPADALCYTALRKWHRLPVNS
jgi:2-hydroxy-6-oxonona-2,4-dienedioate hydrolase